MNKDEWLGEARRRISELEEDIIEFGKMSSCERSYYRELNRAQQNQRDIDFIKAGMALFGETYG